MIPSFPTYFHPSPSQPTVWYWRVSKINMFFWNISTSTNQESFWQKNVPLENFCLALISIFLLALSWRHSNLCLGEINNHLRITQNWTLPRSEAYLLTLTRKGLIRLQSFTYLTQGKNGCLTFLCFTWAQAQLHFNHFALKKWGK